tara:strand:- start:230 stop:955 length:726 start_codon:yes stop_codon:yes gene_type:complete
LRPVKKVNRINIECLIGIDSAKKNLMENTKHFARGLSANNVLLWGSRGMGKSSLVKAVHFEVNNNINPNLYLIEIEKNDLSTIPLLLANLEDDSKRFIIFCDDLSFENTNDNYKSLKTILEGGLEEKPSNVLFYATSNRRHLIPKSLIDDDTYDSINSKENIDEKISLSDRFGIWIGFHKCTHDDYKEMVLNYAKQFNIHFLKDEFLYEATQWSINRGSRSGRVAWQFILNYCAQKGIKLF